LGHPGGTTRIKFRIKGKSKRRGGNIIRRRRRPIAGQEKKKRRKKTEESGKWADRSYRREVGTRMRRR